MDRNASQTAKILGVTTKQIKDWAWVFRENLSAGANPGKGQARSFLDSDILALMFVRDYWEDNPDIENIKYGLNRDEHNEDKYQELLYKHTPILQDPPSDLDETWTHGVLLHSMGTSLYLELARNYRCSAESLLEEALVTRTSRDSAYPILFAYRHTLELYMKIIGEIDVRTHSLRQCVHLVEKRLGKSIAAPIKGWIIELDTVDPNGTAFRYADEKFGDFKSDEFWVDFRQLKYVMGLVFDIIDRSILQMGLLDYQHHL